MSKKEKISWLAQNFLYTNPIDTMKEFASFWHDSVESQKLFDGFSENTLTNFYMPFGVAPNFIINGKDYCVPMVIEESSVVAAASNAAKFWMKRGGFKAEVLSTKKLGQVHFNYPGDPQKLKAFFPHLKKHLLKDVEELTANMRKRGGGILDIELIDFTDQLDHYYQLKVSFETCDSMGANFINSVLESFSQTLVNSIQESSIFENEEKEVQVIMSILSNFTDECLVKVSASCPVEDLGEVNNFPAEVFAEKFKQAVDIACIDPYRATTHNKGIMNGIDAVVIATGNDFRAVESCIHTYAASEKGYKSLSTCSIEDGIFTFEMTVPLALGTVGGLTSLHPLAKRSLELLGKPGATELMMVVAATGLAQNFAAVKSLVTTGIQAGHMKMHLNNILANLQADEVESTSVREYFSDKVVSFSSVRDFLSQLRGDIGRESSV